MFGQSRRVQVKILETTEGYSAPAHVLQRLRDFRETYDLGPEDQLCLVIDKDRWPAGQLGEVAAQSRAGGFLLAVSRPCFEVWLLLHFTDLPEDHQRKTCRHFKQLLKSVVPAYDGTHLDPMVFAERLDSAMKRARELDTAPDARWPNTCGTRVHRVIEAIRARL
jgi:hypothetical protein